MSLFAIPSPMADRPCGRRTSVAPPDDSSPWIIRASHKFFDARLNAIDPRHLKMLLVIEGVCRKKSYGWIGNAQLAARYGCSYRQCQTILREMEKAGLIVRVITEPGRKTDRFGVILLDRGDRSMPVANSEEARAEALRALGADVPAAVDDPSTGANDRAPRARDSSCRSMRFSAHPNEEGSLSKKDELKEDGSKGSARRSRSKTEETRPGPEAVPREDLSAAPPEPVPPAPPEPPAPGPPEPPGLTPFQVEALGTLIPEDRERFDRASPVMQAQFLRFFADRFDLRTLTFAAGELPTPRPELPGPSMPTPELIAYLGGHMGPSLAAMCTRKIMLELDDRGGEKSFGVIQNLCGKVVAGEIDPDDLAVPLARTLEAIRSGQSIPNPAGYWMRSVTNRMRERPPN